MYLFLPISGKEISVTCQLDTWTFMNRYRNISLFNLGPFTNDECEGKTCYECEKNPSAVKGTDWEDAYDWFKKNYFQKSDDKWMCSTGDFIDLPLGNDGYENKQMKKLGANHLIVKCINGMFVPDIFTNQRNWCTEGCYGISKGFIWNKKMRKDVIYPKGSRSVDPFKAPVQRLAADIELPCHYGFTPSKKSLEKKYKSKVRCGDTGYVPAIVAGNFEKGEGAKGT